MFSEHKSDDGDDGYAVVFNVRRRCVNNGVVEADDFSGSHYRSLPRRFDSLQPSRLLFEKFSTHIHGNTAGTGSRLTGYRGMGSNADGNTAVVKCET